MSTPLETIHTVYEQGFEGCVAIIGILMCKYRHIHVVYIYIFVHNLGNSAVHLKINYKLNCIVMYL